MADRYANREPDIHDPPSRFFNISPDDANDLPDVTTAINVATTGVVRVTGKHDTDGTFVDLNVLAGVAFPGRYKRIWSAGTTATGIVGMT